MYMDRGNIDLAAQRGSAPPGFRAGADRTEGGLN